jgi:outer membrane lipoprotein-sorting protein
MKLFFFVAAFFALAFAQDLTAEEVTANLRERAETLQDATFVVTGNLIDADGQELPLEVYVSFITADNVLRAEFVQPDAIADNVLIIDGEDVYSYTYLTNQTSIFNLGDPAALGDLFPQSEDGEPFTFTLNLPELFDGWTISSQGPQDSEVGRVYTLRFDNIETEGILLKHVDATIVEESWVPYTMNFYNAQDELVAELIFNDFVTDSGLNPDDLRYLDPSAEIIDER